MSSVVLCVEYRTHASYRIDKKLYITYYVYIYVVHFLGQKFALTTNGCQRRPGYAKASSITKAITLNAIDIF